jgi:mannose-6-phosphate isomerase-like protein (cupin superfamily)
MRKTLCGLTSIGVACCAFAANAREPSGEERQALQAIENALQKHGGDVHRCFEKSLADRLDTAGAVELSVEVGKGGKVTAAKVKKMDKGAPAALAACVEKAALAWTIDGVGAGVELVLPFSFKPQASQYVVNAADIPDRALGAPTPAKQSSAPKRDVPFTVKVLADETNVKASDMSLTLLSIGPASRVAMHRHPHSAKILYLVKGHARLLGPASVAPIKLDEGAAVMVPAGYAHVIENMGRQSTAIFLQAFFPPGPERVYRDPKDARGRAEFEVIRDSAQVQAPAAGVAAVVVATAADAKAEPMGRAGSSKRLIQGPPSLTVVEWNDGAEARSAGEGTTRAYYFLSGGGTLKVGGESSPVGAESLVFLPRGTAFELKLSAGEKGEKPVAVMFEAPVLRAATPRK